MHPRREYTRNALKAGAQPSLCLPLLCTKAFDFNWASRRESVHAEFQISGKIRFSRIAGAAPATRGCCTIPMEFRETTDRDWNWVRMPIHIYRRDLRSRSRRIASRALAYTWLYFIFGPGWRAATPFATYRSTVRSACLALMRLFCAFQLIPLRERQADVRVGKEEEKWQTDTIGSPGVWQEGSFRLGIFLLYHGIN